MKQNIFEIRGLTNAYKVSLAGIALLATASFAILMMEIRHQESSSHVINFSGRQRMLSQNITKNLILIQNNYSAEVKNDAREELSMNYFSWVRAHNGLQKGNDSLELPPPKLSNANKIFFKEIEPHYKAILHICDTALATTENFSLSEADLNNLLKHEKMYLQIMDKITFQFDSEAKTEILDLKKYDIAFWIITLITLLLEGLFIFRPVIILANKEQRNSIKQIIIAEENERKRIATDLHDSLGQLVLSIKMKLINLLENNSSGTKKSIVSAELYETLDLITDEIRTISYNLMPAALAEFGIGACIEQYIAKVQYSSGAKIQFIQDNKHNKRLEPINEVLVYRVSQELINNALKHAEATEIVVQLLFRDDEGILMVEDNGKGFVPAALNEKASGSGLKNIKTRLDSIGGTISIDSTPEFGTTSIVQIPYSTN